MLYSDKEVPVPVLTTASPPDPLSGPSRLPPGLVKPPVLPRPPVDFKVFAGLPSIFSGANPDPT